METWVIYVILSSLLMGMFECSKKKATEKNSIYEILAVFSTIAFAIVFFISRDVFNLNLLFVVAIFVKSLSVVIAWLLALYAVKKMPISIYGMINTSTIIFSIIMSWLLLKETITMLKLLGSIVVILGLFTINKIISYKENKRVNLKTIIALLASCFLTALSGIIDKKIMIYITGSQMQFWFTFFLMTLYWIILFLSRNKLKLKELNKNYWIAIAAVCLVVAGRLLFSANKMPESKASAIIIINQISTAEMIILGKFMFKEKNIIKKLLCSLLIIFGIVLTII